jgi:hypothetical protein
MLTVIYFLRMLGIKHKITLQTDNGQDVKEFFWRAMRW